jgi:hypothetical protein
MSMTTSQPPPELRAAHAQIAESEEVLWLADPHTNTLRYVSPAYEHIWGRSCASL